MARRVEVGPVEERVRPLRRLDAGVSGAAGVRVDAAAVEDRQRLVELDRLRRVDQVAGHEHRVGREAVDGAHGGGEHLRAERLLRPERGRERAAEAVEERDARRRLLVAHVGVGDLGERGEDGAGPRGRREVGAVGERLAGARLQRAVAVAVHERRVDGRVRRRGRPVAAAAGEQRGHEEQGGGGAHRHSSRSPARIGSRIVRRATSAVAAAASSSRPPATSSAWPSAGASGSSA